MIWSLEGKGNIGLTSCDIAGRINCHVCRHRPEPQLAPEDAFTVEHSAPHGYVEILLALVRRLGLDRVIATRRCPEHDRVVAMVVELLLHPASKLATVRLWHTTTMAAELGVADADEDALYEAHGLAAGAPGAD